MRRCRALCLLLSLLIFLYSCTGRETPSPRELYEKLAASGVLGDGVLYDSTVPREDETYLDPAVFAALYARQDGSCDDEDIAALILYLGSSALEHRELAIFSCRGKDAAREVVSLCRGRAALIGKTVGAQAKILLYGETVVFLSVPDLAAAEQLLDSILK